MVLVLSILLFDYTRFGYDYNALKNGQKVAVNTGIKEIPNAIGCYGICGALMGIVGFLNAARSTTINGGQLKLWLYFHYVYSIFANVYWFLHKQV